MGLEPYLPPVSPADCSVNLRRRCLLGTPALPARYCATRRLSPSLALPALEHTPRGAPRTPLSLLKVYFIWVVVPQRNGDLACVGPDAGHSDTLLVLRAQPPGGGVHLQWAT